MKDTFAAVFLMLECRGAYKQRQSRGSGWASAARPGAEVRLVQVFNAQSW
jgi:hypothetical protein